MKLKTKEEKLERIIKYVEDHIQPFTTQEVMQILAARHKKLESEAMEVNDRRVERIHIAIGNAIAQAIHNMETALEQLDEIEDREERRRLIDTYINVKKNETNES